jgi:hypothetical protein
MTGLLVIIAPAGVLAALILFRWARTLALFGLGAMVVAFISGCASPGYHYEAGDFFHQTKDAAPGPAWSGITQNVGIKTRGLDPQELSACQHKANGYARAVQVLRARREETGDELKAEQETRWIVAKGPHPLNPSIVDDVLLTDPYTPYSTLLNSVIEACYWQKASGRGGECCD